MQKRDSKSFDSGTLYRSEVDNESTGTSSVERIENRIMLPTPPVRMAPIAAALTSTPASQSDDSNASERNKSLGDSLSDSNKLPNEDKSIEPNEVLSQAKPKLKPPKCHFDNKVTFLHRLRIITVTLI